MGGGASVVGTSPTSQVPPPISYTNGENVHASAPINPAHIRTREDASESESGNPGPKKRGFYNADIERNFVNMTVSGAAPSSVPGPVSASNDPEGDHMIFSSRGGDSMAGGDSMGSGAESETTGTGTSSVGRLSASGSKNRQL
jgi:hypothetical protein